MGTFPIIWFPERVVELESRREVRTTVGERARSCGDKDDAIFWFNAMSKPQEVDVAASAVVAAVLTAISAVGAYSLIPGPRWLSAAAFGPAVPAWVVLIPFGGGPEGLPNPPPIALFGLTFTLWWVALYRLFAWYRRESN